VPHINPSWQLAAWTAVLLLVLTLVLRLRGWVRSAAAAREVTIVATLYASWQYIGSITHRNVDGARANALTVLHWQQALHLPSELAMQTWLLPHHWLVQITDAYYVYGHFNPVIGLLAWVWWRHRDQYPRVRLLLCLLTATAFVVHFIPVAPPRLMPELGFRDMLLENGHSPYGSFGAGIPGQLLAMPSLHVGWSILFAYVVITTARSRWRWLALLHPIAMSVDVAVTANHWWADGIVSGVLLALCIGADRAVRAALPAREPVPVELEVPAAVAA
jgi:hypothetical protein